MNKHVAMLAGEYEVVAQEIVAQERRHDVRILVNIPGRYSLSTRRDAQGERREFACRALNMSPVAVLLAAPVIGPLGDTVIADLEHFGRLKGAIARIVERGFVMSICVSDSEKAAFAAKLQWFEQHRHYDINDQREHRRFTPASPLSRLILADGTIVSCLIIDLSVSGAAISADVTVKVGDVLAVGTLPARVVRLLKSGFAVQFIEVQQEDAVEQKLIRR